MFRQARPLLLTSLLLPAAPTLAAPQYTISLIPTPPGAQHTQATALNTSAQIAGFSDAPTLQAFLSTNATATTLGTLGGNWSLAYGINNNGDITGNSTTADPAFTQHAFLYSHGTMTDLGSLGGDACGQAINNNTQIAGYSFLPDRTTLHAFLYANGAMTDLGTLPGYASSAAFALNNAGNVVGDLGNANGDPGHAFLYANNAISDLGTLGGPASAASAINDNNQITGWADAPGTLTYTTGLPITFPTRHAFLYANNTMLDLGTLGGGKSVGNAINTAGDIVGASEFLPNNFSTHAFLYTHNTLLDLNSLIDPASGWTLSAATAINDHGQIIGTGTLNGQDAPFLLTPTPEPASLALTAPLLLLLIRKKTWN
ncbi:MAG: hypothetical protein ACTHN5_09015 [Phycisphaerae bacterium]